MKFLIDTSPADMQRRQQDHADLIGGQLLTPLTRYADSGGTYAIDNGAFSGLDMRAFKALLKRQERAKSRCLFVAIPDVVGNARRTMEIWRHRHNFARHWPMALVAQNGIEDMDIPWSELGAIFIGGRDPWKDSQCVLDIVRTAKTLSKHVHVGRVNEIRRYRRFAQAGADTCDGSGVAMYDHMLAKIARALHAGEEPTLFDGTTDSEAVA